MSFTTNNTMQQISNIFFTALQLFLTLLKVKKNNMDLWLETQISSVSSRVNFQLSVEYSDAATVNNQFQG